MLQYLSILLAAHTPERFQRDERGASAVEYGLLVAGIAAVIVTVVFLLGDNVVEGFTEVNTEMDKH